MRLASGQRLGYCTNVHPYADLPGLLDALEGPASALRARLVRRGRLEAQAALDVGLWLPATLARQLAADPAPLRRRLAELRLAVCTVNAFPYGDFHGARVKDEVFRPTWAQPERLRYTLQAAQVLAALLPEGALGTLSTHTGGYKGWGAQAPGPAAIAAGLLAAAEGLARLEGESGRRLVLCLEPEPFSSCETSAELIAFFERHLLPAGPAAARHLGVCFDVCHQAVQHEDVVAALQAHRAAGVFVGKLQLSSALAVERPARAAAALRPWADDRWFHQVVARLPDGALVRWPDLGAALDDPRALAAPSWRVHFHVPIFAERLDASIALGTTRADLLRALEHAIGPQGPPHLEIETYSFELIPRARREELGAVELLDALALEFDFVLDHA